MNTTTRAATFAMLTGIVFCIKVSRETFCEKYGFSFYTLALQGFGESYGDNLRIRWRDIYQLLSFDSVFLYNRSIPSAPSGAVVKIAQIATVKIVFPAITPAARGSAPIAACTVALGI